MHYLWITLFIFLATCTCLLIYVKYFKSKPKVISTEEPVCEIMFFYTTWCPYCKKARPEWDKFKTPLNQIKRDGYLLIFTEIDCDKNEALANKYAVTGYPTIKLLKDDKITDYDAKPSVETLNAFLDSCFE